MKQGIDFLSEVWKQVKHAPNTGGLSNCILKKNMYFPMLQTIKKLVLIAMFRRNIVDDGRSVGHARRTTRAGGLVGY